MLGKSHCKSRINYAEVEISWEYFSLVFPVFLRFTPFILWKIIHSTNFDVKIKTFNKYSKKKIEELNKS